MPTRPSAFRLVDDGIRFHRVLTVAGAGHPPADDELLLRAVLQLAPRARATTHLVRAVDALGHDPFEPAFLRRVHQRGTVGVARRHEPMRTGLDELFEHLTSILVGERRHVATVDL